MNKEELIKYLEQVQMPNIELKGYKQVLRRALLKSVDFNRSISFWGRFRNLPLRKTAPIGALTLILLTLVTGIVLNNDDQLSLNQAQAREIVENALIATQDLTPEEREHAIHRLSLDPTTILLHAKRSPDLSYVGDIQVNGAKLKVLSYTDPEGHIVKFWIDDNNKVAMYEKYGSVRTDKASNKENWVVYENSCGYTIEYPADWKIYEGSGGGLNYNIPCANLQIYPKEIPYGPSPLIQITVSQENLQSRLNRMALKDQARYYTNLNGFDALEIPHAKDAVIYLLEYKGYVIQIDYWFHESYGINKNQAQEVLSTFRLK